MPLVRIDLSGSRSPLAVKLIADAVHDAIVGQFGIPVRDKFQIINTSSTVVAEDAGLGFDRSEGVVMIQIFTQRGRSQAAKQNLYAAIAGNLEEVGVAPEDVFIGYFENGPEDWSFGFGRAQYLTGELSVPAKN